MSDNNTIPCPSCTGQILENTKDKSFIDLSSGVVQTPVLQLQQIDSVPDQAAIINKKSIYAGNCPDCGGSGTFTDYSNTSAQQTRALQVAKQLSQQILEAEATLDTGGFTNSKHISILGNHVIEVGVGFNKLKPYNIVENGKPVKAKINIGKYGTTGGTALTNQINATNPLATPGGHYYIKCSNKFSLIAGAQGIEFNTMGNLNIVGGVTKIVGAEMNIGSSVGTTTIEGNHLKLTGKTIEITPSNGNTLGQVQVNATLGVDGNIIASGGAHFDGNLHFISATTTRLDPKPTSFGTLPFTTSGKAEWAVTGTASSSASQDLQNAVQKFQNDPGNFLNTPRGVAMINDRQSHLAYLGQSVESVPTGYVTGVQLGSSMLPIFNYPHHHHIQDMAHQHCMDLPNITLLDTDDQVRDQASKCQSPAPCPSVNSGQAVQTMYS